MSEAGSVLVRRLGDGRQVIEAVAGYADACQVSPDEVRTEVIGFVRESLSRGLLIPAN